MIQSRRAAGVEVKKIQKALARPPVGAVLSPLFLAVGGQAPDRVPLNFGHLDHRDSDHRRHGPPQAKAVALLDGGVLSGNRRECNNTGRNDGAAARKTGTYLSQFGNDRLVNASLLEVLFRGLEDFFDDLPVDLSDCLVGHLDGRDGRVSCLGCLAVFATRSTLSPRFLRPSGKERESPVASLGQEDLLLPAARDRSCVLIVGAECGW